MRIFVLAAGMLVVASAASAQTARQRPVWPYDAMDRQRVQPAWTAPIDNRRPPFAAHIGANGQGVD